MKKRITKLTLGTTLLGLATLAIPQIAHAAIPNDVLTILSNTPKSDIVSVTTPITQGTTTPTSSHTVANSKAPFSVDKTLLSSIKNSSHFGQLLSDFQSGKAVIFLNPTNSNKLDAALLRKAFNAPGVSMQHSFTNPHMHVSAVALAKIPGDPYAEEFDIESNGTPTQTDIQATIEGLVQKQTEKFANNPSILNQSRDLSSKSGNIAFETIDTSRLARTRRELAFLTLEPTTSDYRTASSGAVLLYYNGYKAAQYQYAYEFTRQNLSSSQSVWDCQRDDTVTPGIVESGVSGWMSDAEIGGIWESIGVGMPGDTSTAYGGEDMYKYAPSAPITASTTTTTISGDGVPNWTISYNEGGSLSIDSLTSVYGAWENGYTDGTGYPLAGASNSASLSPGIRADNTISDFEGTGDFSLYIINSTGVELCSTGDIYDNWDTPDL